MKGRKKVKINSIFVLRSEIQIEIYRMYKIAANQACLMKRNGKKSRKNVMRDDTNNLHIFFRL